MQSIIQFIAGVKHFTAGASLIFKPGIRRYVLIPLTINIATFIALYFTAKHYLIELNQWVLQHVPAWLQWLQYLIWIIFFLCFVLTIVYLFTIIANIIAAPFNSSLSEAVERHLTQQTNINARTMTQQITDIPKAIAREASIIFYYLPRAFILLLLFFIPLMQPIAGLFWFLFHAWFMSLIYLDYPSDNHHISIRDLRSYMSSHRSLILGFGAATLITAMIPGLNLFVIPIAVAGATQLWVTHRHQIDK